MSHKIIIVGLGNIGRRHLEAIEKIKKEIHIDIYDPFIDKSLLPKSFHKINYLDAIPSNKNYDIGLVSTSSKNRFAAYKELLNNKINNIILEKFLFPNYHEYNEASSLENTSSSNVYVCCPRREVPDYSKLQNKEYKSINIKGNFGLGCNGIHHLDLVRFLNNDSKIKFINFDGLDKSFFKSKRHGYIDFNGRIEGCLSNDCSFVIESLDSYEDIVIDIDDIHINETKGYKIIHSIKSNFDMPFLSSIMTNTYKCMLNNEEIALPDLNNSIYSHLTLFKGFSSHFKLSNYVPIT